MLLSHFAFLNASLLPTCHVLKYLERPPHTSYLAKLTPQVTSTSPVLVPAIWVLITLNLLSPEPQFVYPTASLTFPLGCLIPHSYVKDMLLCFPYLTTSLPSLTHLSKRHLHIVPVIWAKILGLIFRTFFSLK